MTAWPGTWQNTSRQQDSVIHVRHYGCVFKNVTESVKWKRVWCLSAATVSLWLCFLSLSILFGKRQQGWSEKGSFPWRGNVLDNCLVMRTLRGGKVVYHTHHLQARQVSQISPTHTHNLRKWHWSGCCDPHTSTSRHFSLISCRPAAPYRNSLIFL